MIITSRQQQVNEVLQHVHALSQVTAVGESVFMKTSYVAKIIGKTPATALKVMKFMVENGYGFPHVEPMSNGRDRWYIEVPVDGRVVKRKVLE